MSPTTRDEMQERRLQRRQVLKGAGALSAASMVAALLPPIAQPDVGRKTGYQFLNVSDGKERLSGKSIFINGVGKFGSGISGGGRYVVTDTATFSTVFDFGSWEAKEFVRFSNVGTAVAGFEGGTLTMGVILESANGGSAEAILSVNCDNGVVSPNGGDGSGDVVKLAVLSGSFAGTFGPGSVAPFNVTIFLATSV